MAGRSCRSTDIEHDWWEPLTPTQTDEAHKFNRSDYLRVLPPTDPDYSRVYGMRADTESLNAEFERAFYNRRLPAWGLHKSFDVGGDRGGIITFWRWLANIRGIGWQFQGNQLRFQITVEDRELQGKTKRAAREAIVEAEHVDFFDHAEIEQILGPELRAKSYATGKWLGFNPDFVYRHRPVKPSVSTAKLAEALAAMTNRVDAFADRTGYNIS